MKLFISGFIIMGCIIGVALAIAGAMTIKFIIFQCIGLVLILTIAIATYIYNKKR